MKGQRFTEERIAFAPKQADAGTPVEEICRQMVYSLAALRAVNFGHAIECRRLWNRVQTSLSLISVWFPGRGQHYLPQ